MSDKALAVTSYASKLLLFAVQSQWSDDIIVATNVWIFMIHRQRRVTLAGFLFHTIFLFFKTQFNAVLALTL